MFVGKAAGFGAEVVRYHVRSPGIGYTPVTPIDIEAPIPSLPKPQRAIPIIASASIPANPRDHVPLPSPPKPLRLHQASP